MDVDAMAPLEATTGAVPVKAMAADLVVVPYAAPAAGAGGGATATASAQAPASASA